MANFTQQRLIQYKDYVPVNPVELMTSVGIQRETELKTGLQKINNYFDQIAGLDIARDVDKQYVQSRLSDLKTGITNNLSGDFSDDRIVNQIGGAASQIYKDPQVQNAVLSTAAIRKGQSDLESYRKEGKGSVAQEYVFNSEVSRYLQNQDPSASFNGRAKQYSDYRKRAAEALKAATGDETISDNAFTTDGNGNIVIADATVRTKLAGIPPARVQRILMSSLTPEDFDQLAAEGRYNYANKSDEQFATDLQKSYENKRDTVLDYIGKLEAAKSAVKDAGERAKLEDEIAGEKERLNSMQDEYNNITFSGDIETAKAQKGTFDFINNFSNAFAYKQQSRTYEGKTPQEMMMWREDKAQDWKKFSLNYGIDLAKLDIDKQKLQLEKDKAKKEQEGYGALGLPGDQETLPQVSLEKFREDIAAQETPLLQEKAKFLEAAKQHGDINGLSEDQWYAAQLANWNDNPNKVPAYVDDYFSKIYDDTRKVAANKKIITALEDEADKKWNIKPLISGLATQNIPSPEGIKYSYSPQEIVNTIQKFNKYVTASSGSGGTGGASSYVFVDYNKAKQELTPKEYNLFEYHQKGNKYVNDLVSAYNKNVILPYDKMLAEKSKYVNDQLKTKLLANQEMLHQIPTNTPAQKETIAGALSRLATFSKANKDAIANSPDWDADKAVQLAANSDTKYSIVVNEGSSIENPSYKIIAQGIIDKKPVSISANLTPQQKKDVFGSQMFESDPKTREFKQTFGEQLAKAGGNTTSINGQYYMMTKDFPQNKSYGILGNVIQSSPGKYYLSLSVKDPLTNGIRKVQWPTSGTTNEAGIIDAKNSLTDEVIFQLLYGKTPTQEELKELNQKSKQPSF